MEHKLTKDQFDLLSAERQELVDIESKLVPLKALYDSKKASFSRLALMVFSNLDLDPTKHVLDMNAGLIKPIEQPPENVSGVDISEDIGDDL